MAWRRSILVRAGMGLLLAAAVAGATAAGIDGEYRATVDGVDTQLSLRSAGADVSGTYVEGALRLQVAGRLEEDRLLARVREPSTGLDIAALDARIAGDTLDASIDAHNPLTGERKSARALFRRTLPPATDAAATAVPGSLDRSLIGTWVNETMINSGGADFASFTTVMTMQLGADGRVSQWSRSVGGGGDWSYDGAGQLQYSGRWSSDGGVLYVQLDGQAGFQPAARYRFSDAYLVLENDRGRLIWQRR
ncbi:hypothetical protein [Chiayiivirga flava]|nr:hypothetical protein [Chiayiivirga flava]